VTRAVAAGSWKWRLNVDDAASAGGTRWTGAVGRRIDDC
jgi:hypothetical protein